MSLLIDPYRFASTRTAYEAAVLADSPAAFWPMQGASATADEDVIGSADLTWTASPTFQQTGVAAGWESVLFDGSSQYGTRAADAQFPGYADTSQSLECWFKRNTGTAFATIAIMRRAASLGESLTLGHNSPSAGNARGYAHGSFRTTGTGAFNDGAWHHRVDTWDGSTYSVYIDGALLQSGADATSPGSAQQGVVIAANHNLSGGSLGQYFGGWISHVAAYSVTLSLTQVQAHYAAAGF